MTVENLLQDKNGKTDALKAPTAGKVIEYLRDDVLIGNIRPYLRKIWLADRDGGTNGDVLVVRIAESAAVSPEYLYYVLSSEDFFYYDVQNSKGSKMPRGDKKAVMDYRFSLPVPAAQSRLASLLDQFSALCGDLTQGLPAEIAARKKQYEYYRDKLLSFQ